MAVATFTKSGAKASTSVKLDKSVFGQMVNDNQLLKDAYLAYMANGRTNNAAAKRRGEVRGGGRKPWRQKGTGNARFGSSRNPLWRGGGAAFGPTGSENYSRQLSAESKRSALRQALSLAAKEDRILVIESISIADGKTRSASALLKKIGANGSCLVITKDKNETASRAIRNIAGAKTVSSKYLNVFDVLNADAMVFEKSALEDIHAWLGGKK